MEQILGQLVTLGWCWATLGVLYLAWLGSGVLNVAYSKTRKWSWKIFWEDFIKLLMVGGSMVAFVVGVNLVAWIVARMDGNISGLTDDISTAGLLVLLLKGGIGYASKAYTNYKNFFATRHSESLSVELGKPDYAGVLNDTIEGFKKVADMLTPQHLQADKPTEAKAEPTTEEVAEALEGLGAGVSPLSRRLPDGDNDGGKGWQCSKYAYYLATGIRMNHKPHPDYGPCNGNTMVDYLIKNYGFVACEKQDGAIFSYNTGQYGHTGAVLDAKNNLVNDANWTPLRVGTHYLNLDAVGAKYCCLPGQKVSATTSVAKPAQTANTKPVVATQPNSAPVSDEKPLLFHKGEKVKPLRLVDYNGTHLHQYDDVYYVVQDVPEGCDRVVLGARGQIWAAMKVGDVEKM